MIFIERLELENIKSYQKARIEFQEGVNFICGANGAGKTTIVEAVGGALFGYLPFNNADFVRHGESRGKARVAFKGADGNRYISERMYLKNGGGHWRIYDAENGALLEEGVSDVLDMLQEGPMPIHGGKLSAHFQSMIGVPQGMICAPFLETPKKRKEAFDSILQVDGYKKTYDNTRLVMSRLQGEIEKLSSERAIHAGAAEGYDETAKQIEALETELQTLALQKERKENDRQNADAQAKRLRAAQLKIAEAKEARAAAQGSLDTKRSGAETKKKELDEAREAQRICRENENDRNAYLESQDEIETLTAQQTERNTLNEERSEKEQRRASLQSRMETEQKNADQNEKTHNEKLTQVRQKIEQGGPRKRELEAAVADASERRRVWENAEAKAEALKEGLLSKLQPLLQSGINAKNAADETVAEIEALTASLDGYDAVKSTAETREEAEQRRGALQKELNRLEALAEEAEKRQNEAKDGLCPILKERCKNVEGGDLSLRIASDLDAVQARMREPQKQLKAAETEADEAQQAEKRLQELDHTREKIDRLNEQMLYRRGEVERQQSAVGWEEWRSAASNLERGLQEMDPEIAEAARRFSRHTESAEAVSAENLDDWIRQMEAELGNVKNAVEAVSSAVNRQVVAAQEAQRDARTELQLFENEAESFETERSGIEEELSAIQQKRAALSNDLRRLDAMAEDIDALNERLKTFEAMEERMEAARNRLTEARKGYDLYVGSESSAGKAERLAKQLDEARLEEAAAHKERGEAQEALQKLESEFDTERLPTLLEAAEKRRVELEDALAETKSKIAAAEEKRNAARRELSKMEEERRKAEALDARIEEIARAEKLGKFVRDRLLNVVGETISDLYRRKVSLAATDLYRQLSGEPQAQLEWSSDYELRLTSAAARAFRQLSGGEQMSAALSVRLALLGMLSELGIAVFDEPTANLDDERRERLAQALAMMRQSAEVPWRQLFIISHDDTFDSAVESAIRIEKAAAGGSSLAAET